MNLPNFVTNSKLYKDLTPNGLGVIVPPMYNFILKLKKSIEEGSRNFTLEEMNSLISILGLYKVKVEDVPEIFFIYFNSYSSFEKQNLLYKMSENYSVYSVYILTLEYYDNPYDFALKYKYHNLFNIITSDIYEADERMIIAIVKYLPLDKTKIDNLKFTEEALVYCCENDKIDYVKYAVERNVFVKDNILDHCVNSLEIFMYFVSKDFKPTNTTFKEAIKINNKEVMNYCLINGYEVESEHIIVACKYNNLDIIKLCKKKRMLIRENAIFYAVINKNNEIAMYLHQNFNIVLDLKLAIKCCEINNYEFLMYIFNIETFKECNELILKSIESNNEDIFLYLLNNNYNTENILTYIGRFNRYTFLNILMETNNITFNLDFFMDCVSGISFECFTIALDETFHKTNEVFISKVLEYCFSKGLIEFVNYFYQKGYKFKQKDIENACRYNYVYILEYLLDKGCTLNVSIFEEVNKNLPLNTNYDVLNYIDENI